MKMEYDELMKEEEADPSLIQSLPLIQQPETPNEPIDFLSRAWSLSSSEVTKALSSAKPKPLLSDNNNINMPPPSTPPLQINPPPPHHVTSCDHGWKSASSFGRWFLLHRDSMASPKSKKDTLRIQNAHAHASLSVAGLAAAVAAAATAAAGGKGKSLNGGSKMGQAIASAAELLASHCIELAESAGVAPDRISSVVQSAVDIRSAGDLMTLTAAAATALRGEAVFRGRLPKETNKRNPSLPLCHNNNNNHQTAPPSELHSPEEVVEPCAGELLHQTRKGCYRRKHVSVYINKQSEVTVMVVRKHVGGAFSLKSKFLVCGICDEAKTRGEGEEVGEDYCFGLQTCKGYLEFKCESKGEKQWWIDGVENLLRRAACTESDFLSPRFTTDSE